MAVVGLFLEPATPRGRDVSSSAITKTPDPDRTWGGQRDASLLSGGFSLAPWIGWPGPSPPSAPLLPASASPLRCELHDSGALRWCSAQGTTLDLVPLHPPRRRGQRLEKWCLSASLTKQALCKQTTVYSGLPGGGGRPSSHSQQGAAAPGTLGSGLPGHVVRARRWQHLAGLPCAPSFLPRRVGSVRPRASGAESRGQL